MPSRRRFDPRGWSAGLWVVILVTAALVGSVTVSAATRDTDCFPGRLRAAPGTAAPGDTVRITAAAFPCDRELHRGALYGLRFRSGSSAEVIDLGSFPVATDGSFEAKVTVPEIATPAPARSSSPASTSVTCSPTCATTAAADARRTPRASG